MRISHNIIEFIYNIFYSIEFANFVQKIIPEHRYFTVFREFLQLFCMYFFNILKIRFDYFSVKNKLTHVIAVIAYHYDIFNALKIADRLYKTALMFTELNFYSKFCIAVF